MKRINLRHIVHLNKEILMVIRQETLQIIRYEK